MNIVGKYEEEFRKDHPETIGERDQMFDRDNYCEWLEKKYAALLERVNFGVVTYERNGTIFHEVRPSWPTASTEEAKP